MAAMTSTFLGSAVAVKAPVVVSSKKAVAPVASLDGLKKVRAARIDSILFHGENVPCRSIAGEKTYPPPGRRSIVPRARFPSRSREFVARASPRASFSGRDVAGLFTIAAHVD
jgi:hypothetical protein